MRLLLLGGTAFLGRAIAGIAVDTGAEVTALARGSAPAPDGLRFVRANRDDDDALAEVAGVKWDAVIDLSSQPGQVRRAARDLQAAHRVFVSSANVYAAFDVLEQHESAPTQLELTADELTDMDQYGPAKVSCENIIRDAASSFTIVRPGLITGPGDVSGRVGYYPWRFARPTGPDVLAPPDPTFPCAFIDVDDLAAWIVRAATDRISGTFNATGETTPLQEVLAHSRTIAGSAAPPPRYVPAETLEAAGVSEWMGPKSLPLWIRDESWRYFATLDTRAARAAGLQTRPMDDTLRRALDDELVREVPRRAGLTDEDEIALRQVVDRL